MRRRGRIGPPDGRRRPPGPARLAAAFLLGVALGSCGGAGGESGALVLLSLDAGSDPERVALNQPITFLFSRDVDPASVSADTLLLREAPEFAVEARGRFEVEGAVVRFHPDLPKDFERPDGGLRIGARYRVTAPAFPGGRTLAAADGDPLAEPISATFRAASDVDPPLYVDAEPGPPAVLATSPAAALPSGEAAVPVDSIIRIDFGEPLLPRTVGPETVSVLDVTGGFSRRVGGRLGLDQDHAGARVTFAAVPSLPENALVEIRVEGSLLDLGGNAVRPFAGRFRTADAPPSAASLVEEFDDTVARDPGATTAEWPGDGLLRAGLPPGGDGSDGPFEPFESTEIDTDVRAEWRFSRLFVPAGVRVTVRGGRPARFRVAGDATIGGSIVLAGSPGADGDNDRPGGAGGEAGPGGARGGDGGCPASDRLGADGRPGSSRLPAMPSPLGGGGLGGANSTQALGSGGGGGGGFGSAGADGAGSAPGAGGFPTGRPEGLESDGTASGGGGGGGGGCDDDFTAERNDGGGGGGGGGGAFVLDAGGTLALDGSIDAGGGAGGASLGQGGGGGGGAGGLVVLRAANLVLGATARVAVPGGRGGASASEGGGGAGGHGRVRFEDADGTVPVPPGVVVPDAEAVSSAGVSPIPGPGITLAVSRFLDTLVDDPRYAFDGSDPSTGDVAATTGDIGLDGAIPDGARIRVEFEGARGEPGDPSVPDSSTRSGFTTEIRALDGYRFVRFRITFCSPDGGGVAGRPPAIERLAIRYAYN